MARPQTSPLHPTICEGCDAPIWFAVTAGHKAMPVDAAPSDDGNVAVYCDDHGTWRARVLPAGMEPAAYEKRHHTHFTTCDHPEAFRRRQRRQAAADLARDDRNHRRKAASDSGPAVVQPSLFDAPGGTP